MALRELRYEEGIKFMLRGNEVSLNRLEGDINMNKEERNKICDGAEGNVSETNIMARTSMIRTVTRCVQPFMLN